MQTAPWSYAPLLIRVLAAPPRARLTAACGLYQQYDLANPAKILWEPPPDEPEVQVAAEPEAVATESGLKVEAAPSSEGDGAAAVLFTLNVNVTDVEGSASTGVVPLEMVDGATPSQVAAQFATKYGLPEVSKQELTVAIIHYAKENGFVAPTFSVNVKLPAQDVKLPGDSEETAKLNWFPGDQAHVIARTFAQASCTRKALGLASYCTVTWRRPGPRES